MEGSSRTRTTVMVAEAFLQALAARGIDHLFGNAGTDFAPIIEAYARRRARGLTGPVPVTVPHENLAIAMAHGAYLASGRPQAVMLHVGVGTANAICGLINAARENVPIFLIAGRTPITEQGPAGARNAFIHWAQEMYDQAGMVREMVKWEYELRRADQIEAVVDRAILIAMTPPRGPVYLTLPREVLAETTAPMERPATRAPAAAEPNGDALRQAAEWLAAAARPILITAGLGRDPREASALAAFAERQQVPVIAYRPRYMALPHSHPAHAGYEPGHHVAEADLILVVSCDVPWIPANHAVNPAAKIVHIGLDPTFARYPMRCFPSHLQIAGDPASVLERLAVPAGSIG